MPAPPSGRDAVAAPMSTTSVPTADFRRGLALAGIGAVLFSAKAIVAKLMYRYHVDAVTVLTLRMLFAAPFFAAIAAWEYAKAPSLAWRDRAIVVVLGLIGYYLSSFLDFLGLQYISAGLERLILFLTPSFVLLISTFALKRRIAGRQWLAMLIAYAGIVLVFAHDLSFAGEHVALGTALVFGSALAYSLYLIGTGELVGRVGPTRLVAYAMCVSTIACVIQYGVLRPWSGLVDLPMPVYGLSAINAVFCTVTPVVLTMWAVARIGAPSASQAGMIGPVSTLFLGAWLLGEPITLWQSAGCALVMSGMYVLSAKRPA